MLAVEFPDSSLIEGVVGRSPSPVSGEIFHEFMTRKNACL